MYDEHNDYIYLHLARNVYGEYSVVLHGTRFHMSYKAAPSEDHISILKPY